MPATSEARIAANRANSLKSTGPKSIEGRERSRGNALKHGMTGEGVVLSNEDAAEVERRFMAFRAELQPSGEVGEALVRRAAICSIRMDRGVAQETAALSERVRQAEADFEVPEGVDAAEGARLRAEAGCRAMFDPSKEVSLARKYEAAAERGFFRALKELRQLEKQAKVDESAVEEEAYRRALGSFLPLEEIDTDLDRMEAKFDAMDLEPVMPAPSRRPSPASPAAPPAYGGRVDVPFTIGRPR